LSNVWEATPGLTNFVREAKMSGKQLAKIAREAEATYGVELTSEQVRKKLARMQPVPGVTREVTDDVIKRIARESKKPVIDARKPIGREFDDLRNIQRYNPVRVAILDIEATGLNAMFGRVLCACLLFTDEEKVRVYRGDEFPEWKTQRSNDSGVVGALLADMEDADIIIAHNGLNYDMPMLRTRALAYDMPPVHPKKIIDPVWKARKDLRLPSNGLAMVAEFLGVTVEKTRVAADYWVRAGMDGDAEAMDYIVDHCIKDVYVLEEVAWRLRKHVRVIDNIGSWR
jgi:uncharacterized protein YprB with RNaseH-like and TPR domain